MEVGDSENAISKMQLDAEHLSNVIDDHKKLIESIISRRKEITKIGAKKVATHLVIMLVAPSGSGKTTFCDELLRVMNMTNMKQVCYFSADNYMYVGGTYVFNPAKLVEAHNSCKKNFELALDRQSLVIVDNTNVVADHREAYISMMGAHNRKVKDHQFKIVYVTLHDLRPSLISFAKENYPNDVNLFITKVLAVSRNKIGGNHHIVPELQIQNQVDNYLKDH